MMKILDLRSDRDMLQYLIGCQKQLILRECQNQEQDRNTVPP